MQLTQLFDDDQAVSPVIGVILMVAITVILAAVIGTFVLGLGDQIQNDTPSAQFTFDFDDDKVTITHEGGDNINADNLNIKVAGTDAGTQFSNSFTTVSTGNSVTVSISADEEVRIIFVNPNGQSSNTIGKATAPSDL